MTKISQKHLRIIKTCNLYFSSTVSGMSMAVIGPTLLDLQNIVETDTKHIGFVYTGRSSGYLLGSIIGGVVFDMTPRKQFLMTIFNFLIAISTFAIPWSRSIEVLTSWMVLNGMSMGSLDTGLNVCCLNLWGKDSGPFYQALHFIYGFGGLVAPLVTAPFLGSYNLPVPTSMNSSAFFTNQTFSPNFEPNSLNESLSTGTPTVFYGYAIIGSLALLVTALFLVVCIIAPLDDNGKQKEAAQIRKRSLSFILTVVLLNFILLFVETGTEIGYAQMVATYAVKGPLKLSPATGSYITSTFWAAFTLSRFSAIFLAIKFSNLTLIVVDLIVTSAGALVLLFFASTVEWPLWLASVLIGIGIAPLFPTAVAWIEQYITITNKIVALFATGAAFGEMAIPYTISHFIEEAPDVLSYVVCASCVLSAIFAFILYLILRNKEDKYLTQEGISNAACDANADT